MIRQQQLDSESTGRSGRAPASVPVVVRVLRTRLATADLRPFDLELPDGSAHRVGTGAGEPAFRLRLRTPAALWALGSLDECRIGEAYMDGEIDFEGDILAAFELRSAFSDTHPLQSIWRFLQPLLLGRVRTDKRWVAQHYDYGNDLYFAFLDRDLKLYSQALFLSEDETLEQAVRHKLDYIMRACRLRPGSHVLDVGGGWGSFARYASPRGVNVTMLTISPEQYRYLTQWCAGQQTTTLEAVYESIFAYTSARQYDAIVLLGVMEHLPDYPALFAKFAELLQPNGCLYMDFAAGRKKFDVSSFTYRYVFPGAHTPVVLPDLLAAANRTRFEPIALHNDRHSYYLTLQAWARNLEAAHDDVVPIVGERIYRLFQLYLWGGAYQLKRDGALESYRLVFQKSYGAPSSEIGLDRVG
jgi:cyclopropane-fatty-acyl-phospholipid synthase